MNEIPRWIVAAVSIALVVCLLVWARGDQHHRGDEVGSVGIAHSGPAVSGGRTHG
jgi:hypothetical protein